MMKQAITIKGREYRVECNWNAIMSFLSARGTDKLSALSCLDDLGSMDATLLMLCCIAEGERQEGRPLSLDVEDLATMKPLEAMRVLKEFLQIYAEQASPQGGDEDRKGKKKV